MKNVSSKKLVEQQQALNDFFDSLMKDVQAYAEQEEQVMQASAEDATPTNSIYSEKITTPPVMHTQTVVATPEPEMLRPVVDAKPSLDIFNKLPPVAPSIETIPVTEIPAITPHVPENVAASVSDSGANATTDQKPEWANHPFQALLFKVAGLTLAVRLVELNGILEWKDSAVTRMPGHADFYLGLMPHLGRNVAMIDTARLVLPPDKLADLAGDDPYERVQRVVLIQDGRYGLACDDVAEVITLKPDEVRWRTSRTQRRWLAGTVVAQMCALIDADAFAKMLAERMPVKAFRE